MRAGDLDRRITIQSVTTVQNSYGDPVESWSTFASVWASVKPYRGNEEFDAEHHRSEELKVFKIRYRQGLNHKMRIVYEGANYDIRSIKEIGRREGLEIEAMANLE